MVNVKDVLIAFLAAYFVLDIMASMVLKSKRPLLFESVMEAFNKEKMNLFIALGVAVAAGAGAYYLVSTQLK